MRKYDRYRGENLLINGLWGVLFGTFPIIAILIYLAVAKTIEGFSVAPNVLVILILVSCFLSVLLNNASYLLYPLNYNNLHTQLKRLWNQ